MASKQIYTLVFFILFLGLAFGSTVNFQSSNNLNIVARASDIGQSVSSNEKISNSFSSLLSLGQTKPNTISAQLELPLTKEQILKQKEREFRLQGPWQNFLQKYGKDWSSRWNKNGTISMVYGKSIPVEKISPLELNETNIGQISRAFIEENKGLFGVGNEDLRFVEGELHSTMWYVFFQQYYNNLPVYNSRVGLRIRNDLQKLVMFEAYTHPNINISTEPQLTKETAEAMIKSKANFNEQTDLIHSKELLIYVIENDFDYDYRLAWKIDISTQKPMHEWTYFIDAQTGEVLKFFDNIENASIPGNVSGSVYPDFGANPGNPEISVRPFEDLEVSAGIADIEEPAFDINWKYIEFNIGSNESCTGPENFMNFGFDDTGFIPVGLPDGWSSDCDYCDRYYRGTFTIDGPMPQLGFSAGSDNGLEIYINGTYIGSGGGNFWNTFIYDPNYNTPSSGICQKPNCFWDCWGGMGFVNFDLTPYLQQGENLIAVHVSESWGVEMFNFKLNKAWKYLQSTSCEMPEGFSELGFDDSELSPAVFPNTNWNCNNCDRYYRKVITVPGTTTEAYFQASSDDGFELYVNGNYVISGGGNIGNDKNLSDPNNDTNNSLICHKPGTFYSNGTSGWFPIPAEYFNQGENVIAVHVSEAGYGEKLDFKFKLKYGDGLVWGSDFTDEEGNFNIQTLFEGETGVEAWLIGRYTYVHNYVGNNAYYSDIAQTGVPEILEFDNSNSTMAERNVYYQANYAHDYVKQIDSTFDDLDFSLRSIVNKLPSDLNCGAQSSSNPDDRFIVFSSSGSRAGHPCENLALLSDVIHHEYAHQITGFQYTGFNLPPGKMGEAFSDYFANTITNRRELALGIYQDAPYESLRPKDPERKYPASECGFPEDVNGKYYCHSEVLSGALWHMRENFIDKNGYDVGKAYSDYLYHFAKYGKPPENDTPPTSFEKYLLDILQLDDNDGDLTNLTPNYKEICTAFGRHNIKCPYASPYNCGEMRNNITLEVDVSTPNDCMNITTSGVTLDCAGHQIAGTDHGGSGIYLFMIQNATIKNCKISNFWAGVYLDDYSLFHPLWPSSLNNTITNNQLYDNNVGVAMFRTHNSYIRYNEIYGNIQYHGIYLNHSEGTEINNNKIYGNEQSGILASNDNSNLKIHDNNSFSHKGSGIELMGSSPYANIYNNLTYDNWISGIQVVLGSNYHDIHNNASHNNSANIRTYQSQGSNIHDNNARDSSVASIVVEVNSQQNNVYRNYINDAIGGSGIAVRYGSKDNNMFDNNVYVASLYGGLTFEQAERNTAKNNRFYGTSAEANGVRFLDSNTNIIEGGIIADNNYDVSSSNSFNTLRDVSFDKSSVRFKDDGSSITIEWYMNVKVIDDSNVPVGSANVTISNDFGIVFSGTTNGFGYIPKQNAKEYVQFGDGSKIYHTPHAIEAQKAGFIPAADHIYMGQSKEIVIVLVKEKQAGALCNSDSECTSDYCEGSLSHEKRCCSSAPPNDGWYGGGNSSGCGADPTSNFEDYYCNAIGNAQYETTGAKNCDNLDDCVKKCEGNRVLGELDYYVIQDTNQCASMGGGIVEDCMTKISADTDGGNKPLIFGIVTDYYTCSEGACVGPNYSDTCQSATNLLEYFSLDENYSTQNWLCGSFEVAATDAYGNDPTHTETCTAGTGAGCTSGKFSTTAGTGGTDHCQGTCGTGNNSCVFVEYYPVDSADGCPLPDTCTSMTYVADAFPNTCNECKGANYWALGGETAQTSCCGDDSSEYKQTRACEVNACTSDQNDDACCTATSKCVYNSLCYNDQQILDVDNDTQLEACSNGVWKLVEISAPELYSPDNNSVHVNAVSLYFDWGDIPYATKYKLTIFHPVHGTFIFNPTESQYLLQGDEWSSLKDGTYTWKVSAFVNDEEGPASEERSFTKLTTPALLFPADGAKYAYRTETLHVTWEDTGAEKYKLKIILLNGMPFEQEIAGTEYAIPPDLWNILKDGTYKWSAASIVGSYMGPYSEEWHLTKDTIPVLLSPYNGAELDSPPVTFDWADVENADFYKARATIPGNPNPIEFQLPPGQSYFTIYEPGWNNLPNGEYTWQIKSVKGTKESNYSGAWTFKKTG